MFVAAIIPLTAVNTPAPEANHFFGREAHALFLDLVRRADPALANALHEPRGHKPFTVSDLTPVPSSVTAFRTGSDRRKERGVRSGARYEWRVTAFSPSLSQLLIEQALPNLPREVRLGAAHFGVGEPICDKARHPWTGQTDAAALVEKWLEAGKKIERRFVLDFASPTAYRHIHRNVLVPNPAGIFSGYLAAWNANCAPHFEDDLIAQVEAEVSISRYSLRTERADFGEFVETGWVGQCGFTIFSEEFALRRVIQLLADFSFYCGTGYKTTHGMGQTRKNE